MLLELLAIVGFVFGIIGTLLSIISYIKVEALVRSTHTIQYVDPTVEKDEKGFEVIDKKTREKLEDESDLWDAEDNFEEMH